MLEAADSRSERYSRYSDRSMMVIFGLMLIIGVVALSVALQPDGLIAKWLPRLSVTFPIAIIIVLGALGATLRGDRWEPDSSEACAIRNDEWRQMNMGRALRAGFFVVLAMQFPLALMLSSQPSPRSVIAMAIATMTFGLAALSGFFLFFERDSGDDR